MLFHVLSIFGVLTLGLCTAEKLHLPVPTCNRNATDYFICLKRAIKEAWPLFIKGLPTEFDFPPLDPYFYEYQKGIFDNGDIHAEISVSNVTIMGMAEIRFKTVKPSFNDDAFRLWLDLRLSKVFAYGMCEAHGTLSAFRMGGKRNFNLSLEDIRATWDMSGPVKDDTWTIEHFRIIPIFRSLHINVENLFENNREINDLAMMFVNEYWPQLYRVILPIGAETWDTFFSTLVTRFFAKLSFSEVFP